MRPIAGSKEANKHESKKLKQGRGSVGKPIFAGIKDRETNTERVDVVPDTEKDTMNRFVNDNKSTPSGQPVYSD